MINKHYLYLLLLFLCLISRILTSIFYIEDIDSLRFAYSIVEEYNILKLQPHFPGYIVFCFIANILYNLIGNIGLTFSLIGGFSVYLIIIYSLKILKYNIETLESLFFISIVFFNPMFWIMSNRYMPDLMGLAFFIISFYFISNSNNRYTKIGGFIAGLLCGIRISYFPLLIIIFIQKLIYSKSRIIFLNYFFIGILIWLIPLIYITGFNNLILVAIKHTLGHFNDYGGTIITESDWITRFKYFFHTIWSDGLGGYWYGRNNITILSSIILLSLILTSINNFKIIIKNINIRNLILASLFYIAWILFFQNIIYKSRHVMPLILVLLILFSKSYKNIFVNKIKLKKVYLLFTVLIISTITISLSIQHKKPTAINKLSQYLINQKRSVTIISIPLINYYLKSQNINANYIDIDNENKVPNINLTKLDSNIVVIGDFIEIIESDFVVEFDTTFYHNPYVNRMWSSINLYSNRKL